MTPDPPRIPDLVLVHRLGGCELADLWLARTLAGAYKLVKVVRPETANDVWLRRQGDFAAAAARCDDLLPNEDVGVAAEFTYGILPLIDARDSVPVFAIDSYVPRTVRSDLDLRGRYGADEARRVAAAALRGAMCLLDAGLNPGRIGTERVAFVDGRPRVLDEALPASATNPAPSQPTPAGTGAAGEIAFLLAEMLLGYRPASSDDWNSRGAGPEARRVLRVARRALRRTAGSEVAAVLALRGDLTRTRPRPPLGRFVLRWSLTGVLVAAGIATGWRAIRARQRAAAGARLAAAFDPRPTTPGSGPGRPELHGVEFSPSDAPMATTTLDSGGVLSEGLTVEAWVRPASLQGTAGLMGELPASGGRGAWEFAIRYRTLELSVAGIPVSSPPVLVPAQWQHIAATWDPKTRTAAFFVDGALRGTGRATARMPAHARSGVWVGGNRYPDDFYGTMAELRIWSRPRSAEEIHATYARPLYAEERADRSLSSYWPMDEGAGLVALDRSAHGRDLVLGPADAAGIPAWSGRDTLKFEVPAHAAPPRIALRGFHVREFARLPLAGRAHATLAIAPEGSLFPPGVYVSWDLSAEGRPWDEPEFVLRIEPDGRIERFSTLEERDTDASALWIPSTKEWGEYLYVCANNRDGYAPWDGGGAILRLDAQGHESVFVPNSLVLSEPRALAAGPPPGSGFPPGLYVFNQADPPWSIFSVEPDGRLGKWKIKLPRADAGAFGPCASFGDYIYYSTDTDLRLQRVDPAGNSAPFGHPFPVRCVHVRGVSAGPLGCHLYATDTGAWIHRLAPDGTVEPVAEMASGNHEFALSPDGERLFIVEPFVGRIWVMEPD